MVHVSELHGTREITVFPLSHFQCIKMAATGEDTHKRVKTNGNSASTPSPNAECYQFPPPAEPVRYKNAREYAQVLRPWLWQYYTMSTMQQFLSFCPPPCFQANQFAANASGISGPNFQQQQQANYLPPRAPQGRTVVNGHVSTPHRFAGETSSSFLRTDAHSHVMLMIIPALSGSPQDEFSISQ